MGLKKIVRYHNNGMIYQEYSINIKTGLKEGEYKSCWYNGELYNTCTYKNGKVDGESKVYYGNGKLDYTKYFSNGKIISKEEYLINNKNNKINVSYWIY